MKQPIEFRTALLILFSVAILAGAFLIFEFQATPKNLAGAPPAKIVTSTIPAIIPAQLPDLYPQPAPPSASIATLPDISSPIFDAIGKEVLDPEYTWTPTSSTETYSIDLSTSGDFPFTFDGSQGQAWVTMNPINTVGSDYYNSLYKKYIAQFGATSTSDANDDLILGSTTFQPESGESPTGSGGDQGYLFTNDPRGLASSTGYAADAVRELMVDWYNAYSDGSFCDNDPTGLTGAAPCTNVVEEIFWSDPATVAEIESAAAVNPYNINP